MTIPTFQMHHRLALALEAAGLTAPELATALGVARTTVYSWMSGDRTPKLGMVKQWALICQVPWEWIATGELPVDPKGGGDSASVTLRQPRGNTLRLLKLAA